MTLAHEITGPDGAPVLVLLGSLGSTRAMWDPQVGPLTETLRVLRVDTRGHGASAVVPGAATIGALAQDVLGLLDSLGLERVHLAGLSLGGTMAQWIAVHAPSRVASLALLATSAHWPDAQPWRDRAATTRSDGTASIAETVVDRWFTPALAQRDPVLVAWARDMVASTDGEGYAAACDALATWDGRADLGRITARTLVIAGTDDPATPPAMLREIADGITGAELHELPGGHLVNVESAGAVTALLLAHVLG